MKARLLLSVLAGFVLASSIALTTRAPGLRIVAPERIAVRAHRPAEARLTVELQTATNSDPRFSIELRDGEQRRAVPAIARRLDATHYALSAQLPPLFAGTRDADVRAGGLLSATPIKIFVTPLRRKPARLSTEGTLRWRGQPFLPIGLYHVNHTEEEYALLAANGFNTVQGHFTTNLEQFRETLDLALRHNLAVDVPLHTDNLVAANLEISLAKVRANATHPAVLSWKICDEPDADQWARLRDEVPPVYLAIKQANRKQPLGLTLSQDESLGLWSKFCDIVQIDRYPVPGRPLTEVSDFCRNARKAKEPWQNLNFVVQCGWTPDLRTQPTFAQARTMVYLALIGGAKGIFWYSRQDPGWDLTTTPLWPRLKEINAEIASLSLPLLLGRKAFGIRCTTPTVQFTARRYLHQLYLLATNPGDVPEQPVFTLPASLRVRAARDLATSQAITISRASVQIPLNAIDSATIVFDLESPI
jgi:hypothetical protein